MKYRGSNKFKIAAMFPRSERSLRGNPPVVAAHTTPAPSHAAGLARTIAPFT